MAGKGKSMKLQNKKYPIWIDEFAKSVFRLFKGMDLRTMEPLDCFHFHPLYSDLWIEKIYQAIKKFKEQNISFKEQNISFKEVINSFPNPSSARAMIEFMVLHWNNVVRLGIKVDKNKVKEIFDFFVKILKIKNKKDIFCYKSNIVHNQQEIENLIRKIKWLEGNPEISQALGKLYLAISSLVNGIMNDWCTDVGIEVWGPYDVSKYFGKNTVLIIRDFPVLKLPELWLHHKKYKYKKARIYTIYKNIKVRMEYVSCHTIVKGDLAKNLICYAFILDEKYISNLNKMKKLANHFLKLAEEQYVQVKNLDYEDLKQKLLEQERYQLYDFFKLVKMDWKLSEEMRKRVKNRQLLKNIYPLTSYQLSREEINKFFGIDNLKRLYFE